MFRKKKYVRYVYVNKRDSSKKLDDEVEEMKYFWWPFSMYVIASGVISLFIAGIIFDKKITISIMNSWVGIVLGLVATVIGIISMFLSFYNLDQSIKTQNETVRMINELKEDIMNKIDRSFKETQDFVKNQKQNSKDSTTSIVGNSFEKSDINLERNEVNRDDKI